MMSTCAARTALPFFHEKYIKVALFSIYLTLLDIFNQVLASGIDEAWVRKFTAVSLLAH